MSLPQFFITGAPASGTSALHAALATHPDLFLPAVKEPRYFLANGAAPADARGPGDTVDAQEWTWTRAEYEALFAAAPPTALRGEATPYYLSDPAAPARIHQAVPDAKLIAIVRDPVDRAYSNWNRQWSTTFETLEFLDAVAAEEQRAARGWDPRGATSRSGDTASSWNASTRRSSASRSWSCATATWSTIPRPRLRDVCRFLGVADDVVDRIPPVRVSVFTSTPGSADRRGLLGRRRRAGADPATLTQRPDLTPAARRELVAHFADDIRHLEDLTGHSYAEWLSDESAGTYSRRRRFARTRELA